LLQLHNGLPVVLQHSALSPTLSLRVITPRARFSAGRPEEAALQVSISENQPGWGLSSLGFDVLPNELTAAISQARALLESAANIPAPANTEAPSAAARDPAEVLQDYFTEIVGAEPGRDLNPAVDASARAKTAPLAPVLVVLSGDFVESDALRLLDEGFGDLDVVPFTPGSGFASEGLAPEQQGKKQQRQAMDIESTLPIAVAQVQLGYIVQAPAPGEPAAAAWQMTLYIFSHYYEGRLGQEAIARRGLIYYVDNHYQSDGRDGWITLDMGVDPDKLPAMKQLLRSMLRDLVHTPPSQKEVDEARHYLLGRYRSGAQSNPELTDRLAREWLWYGRPVTYEQLQQRLDAVERQDIIDLLPAFTSGTTIAILNPQPQP
jgi:hypothetical protein